MHERDIIIGKRDAMEAARQLDITFLITMQLSSEVISENEVMYRDEMK
jgi:hypothetical protein